MSKKYESGSEFTEKGRCFDGVNSTLHIKKPWRPKGWERILEIKPYGESGEKAFHKIDQFSYEAGADAMLEALREKGWHVEGDASFSSVGEHCTLSNKNGSGNYLFIPDDEEV